MTMNLKSKRKKIHVEFTKTTDAHNIIINLSPSPEFLGILTSLSLTCSLSERGMMMIEMPFLTKSL